MRRFKFLIASSPSRPAEIILSTTVGASSVYVSPSTVPVCPVSGKMASGGANKFTASEKQHKDESQDDLGGHV